MSADGITLEQTVIGHALNSTACYNLFVVELQHEHFAVPNHRVLAYCLKQMSSLGIKRPDEDSFQLVYRSYPGEDKDYGGTEYIRQLKASFLEPTDNYPKFIERIKLQAVKRKLGTDQINKLISLSNNPNSTIIDIRSAINEIIVGIDDVSTTGYNFLDSIELGELYLDEIVARAKRHYHTTGFVKLDQSLTEGFAPKKVSVIAGFTGMAKSTVTVNMAYRIAVQGICTAIFSMETTNMSLFDKLVSALSNVPITRLKKNTADLTEQEVAEIRNAVEIIGRYPLLINDASSVTMDGVFYQIQSAQRRGYDPKVIFIDLFGKIEDVDTGNNLAARIQREMKRIRVLAKTLDVHFVCVVQIGRQGYGRTNVGIRRPTLLDIKNANAYAEESDTVLLLHRNKYYLPDLQQDILEVHIAKQRDGEANERVYYEFVPELAQIRETQSVPHDVGN